jgi:hypothetical protein
MGADTLSDGLSLLERDSVDGGATCANCQERSYLGSLVAELLRKNQLFRFKLSQSLALIEQLLVVIDQFQEDPETSPQNDSSI